MAVGAAKNPNMLHNVVLYWSNHISNLNYDKLLNYFWLISWYPWADPVQVYTLKSIKLSNTELIWLVINLKCYARSFKQKIVKGNVNSDVNIIKWEFDLILKIFLQLICVVYVRRLTLAVKTNNMLKMSLPTKCLQKYNFESFKQIRKEMNWEPIWQATVKNSM